MGVLESLFRGHVGDIGKCFPNFVLRSRQSTAVLLHRLWKVSHRLCLYMGVSEK